MRRGGSGRASLAGILWSSVASRSDPDTSKEGMEDTVRMGPVSQDNVQCRDADSSCCERNTEANNNVVMG